MSLPRTVRAALTLAAASGLALSTAPAGAAAPSPPPPPRQAAFAKVYAATAKYAYEPLAIKDGFARTDECAADPDLGGMGYHYINPANMGSVDPAKPAALLYEATPDGKRELIAVEWIVVDADQDKSTADDRPSLFGQPFDGPMDGHYPGMPIHYDLHAWLYKDNPSGRLSPGTRPSTAPRTPDGAREGPRPSRRRAGAPSPDDPLSARTRRPGSPGPGSTAAPHRGPASRRRRPRSPPSSAVTARPPTGRPPWAR